MCVCVSCSRAAVAALTPQNMLIYIYMNIASYSELSPQGRRPNTSDTKPQPNPPPSFSLLPPAPLGGSEIFLVAAASDCG